MMSWVKDPFVHFIALGVALFVFHGVWTAQKNTPPVVQITAADRDRQILAFTGENRRAPSPDERAALENEFIREEVLVREARRRGLDRGDFVIRQRLVEKMEFLLEDVAVLPEPTDATLSLWYDANVAAFKTPETVSLTQIFIDPEQRASTPMADAKALLKSVQTDPRLDPLSLGDPFLLQKQFTDITQDTLARLLGDEVAQPLFAKARVAKAGEWVGAFTSNFGIHLIRIDAYTPVLTPAFDTLQAQVKTAWQAEKREAQNKQAIDTLISAYEIECLDSTALSVPQ